MGGRQKVGIHGAAASRSSHAESSWRLNELMEGAIEITIEERSLFRYFTISIEMEDILLSSQLGPCRSLNGRPLMPCRTGGIKKEAEVQIQSSRKHIVYDYEVSTKAISVKGMQNQLT